jgi:hypothetical protein
MSRVRLQVRRKRLDGKCFFCSESDYSVLQCHRIVPGEQGGEYRWESTMTLCANCHAKVTAGEIVVHARLKSTAGPVIHCTVDGKEQFIPEWSQSA